MHDMLGIQIKSKSDIGAALKETIFMTKENDYRTSCFS